MAMYVLFVLVLVNSYFWVALFYAAVSTGPLAVYFVLYLVQVQVHTHIMYIRVIRCLPTYFNNYVHTYVSHRQRFFHLGARHQRSCQISDRIMHYMLVLLVESQSQAARSTGLYISIIYVHMYVKINISYICQILTSSGDCELTVLVTNAFAS